MNILDKYDTVFVVGNGFDINVGLKTSYEDFINSDFFRKIENSFLIDYLRERINIDSNWVDIENKLSEYSHNLFFRKDTDVKADPKDYDNRIALLRSEYKILCIELKNYLSWATQHSCQTSSIAFNALYRTLDESSTYILNFNYTNTIKNNLHINSSDKYYINHVHGSLDTDIVFGVEDSFNLRKEHCFLYKSHSKYQNIKGLDLILDGAQKIIFFGYSLGKTDHSYFDDFFKKQSEPGCDRKEFVFYYYGDDSYDDIIWQLKHLTGNQTSKFKERNVITFINTKQ